MEEKWLQKPQIHLPWAWIWKKQQKKTFTELLTYPPRLSEINPIWWEKTVYKDEEHYLLSWLGVRKWAWVLCSLATSCLWALLLPGETTPSWKPRYLGLESVLLLSCSVTWAIHFNESLQSCFSSRAPYFSICYCHVTWVICQNPELSLTPLPSGPTSHHCLSHLTHPFLAYRYHSNPCSQHLSSGPVQFPWALLGSSPFPKSLYFKVLILLCYCRTSTCQGFLIALRQR